MKENLLIGMAVSRSGKYSPQGSQSEKGLACYVRDVNARGGIFVRGRGKKLPVQLILYDDGSDTEAVRQCVTRLIRKDRVDLLIGPYSSGLTMAALQVAEKLEYVVWNHGGADDKIFRPASPWVVGVLTPASRYFTGLLQMAKSISSAPFTLMIVHGDTGFSRAVAEGAQTFAEKENCRAITRIYRATGADVSAIIGEIAAEKPDLLLVAGRLEDDLFFTCHVLMARPEVKAIGVIAAGIARFQEVLGEKAEGFFAPSQWEPHVSYQPDYGPTPDEFVQRFQETSTLPLDYPAAQAYAAGLVAQRCIEEAGCLDQHVFREVAGRLRMSTFFGPFAIDPTSGKQTAHPMLTVQWQRGAKVIVWPPEVAEAAPVYPLSGR